MGFKGAGVFSKLAPHDEMGGTVEQGRTERYPSVRPDADFLHQAGTCKLAKL